MKKTSLIHKVLWLCHLLLLSALPPILSASIQRSAEQEMRAITLEQLEAHSVMQTKQYLYIGRDDCPDCQAVYPRLTEVNQDNHLGILYYSTSQDRESRPEEMYEVLDALQVDSVPMILLLESGEVRERYSGEDFLALYP